jgi:hypothetical protein
MLHQAAVRAWHKAGQHMRLFGSVRVCVTALPQSLSSLCFHMRLFGSVRVCVTALPQSLSSLCFLTTENLCSKKLHAELHVQGRHLQ